MGKKIFRVIKTILFILIIIAALMSAFLLIGKNKALDQQINPVDLAKIPDGVYVGAFNDFRWSNKVEVTVDNHEIVAIAIQSKQLIDSAQVMDQLIPAVIAAQSPDVDAVSGATADSNAYLKAIENALTLD